MVDRAPCAPTLPGMELEEAARRLEALGNATRLSIYRLLVRTGPDGLAVDEGGRLAVAHAGLGVVWIFSRLGEPQYRIDSCRGLLTTNVAYASSGNPALFITESETGSILRAPLPPAGPTDI